MAHLYTFEGSAYDDKWSGGSLYGIRCEVPGVQYSEVIADSSWTAD